mgnify:FL=1
MKLMIQKDTRVKNARVLVLGITFKEDCPDVRNSKVIDVINEFKSYNTNVSVYDPYASKAEVKKEYGVDLIDELEGPYDAIVLAVSHAAFASIDFKAIKNDNTVIYDVKSFLPDELIDKRL